MPSRPAFVPVDTKVSGHTIVQWIGGVDVCFHVCDGSGRLPHGGDSSRDVQELNHPYTAAAQVA
jgi:hypothetical protein